MKFDLIAIQNILSKKAVTVFGTGTETQKLTRVSGGDINEAFCWQQGNEKIFCKVNSATNFPQLFEKEKRGLELISAQNIFKTPAVIAVFEEDGLQFLLLEWIETVMPGQHFFSDFGSRLAQLHQCRARDFGLDEDNYMGSVPQSNQHHEQWISFFVHERLQPLVTRCLTNKLLQPLHLALFENLYKRLPHYFDTADQPSLVHGDLWSGNFMSTNEGAVLIDPAVHYGHSAADLGLTHLFGGFPDDFYEAYYEIDPPARTKKDQCAICNLYPLLIHLYLFGSGYLSRIEKILIRYANN